MMPQRARSWPTSRAAALASALLMLTMGLAQAPGLAQQPALPEEVGVDPPFLGTSSYEEDFQDDEGGWEADNRPAPTMTWEHGEPSSGPGQAYAGENVWATDLDGDYRSYECGVLVSPEIDLTDASSAEVSIQHAYEFYQGSLSGDGGVLLVSTDGGDTFERVNPEEAYDAQLSYGVRDCLDLGEHATGFSGSQPDYASATVDLDAYTGEQVRFALGFASGDSSQAREGWYMDAFSVTIDGETETDNFADEGGFSFEAFQEPEQPLGWEWGTPSSSAGPSFDEPTRLWGTNLDDDHGKNECSAIESPPINLSGDLASLSPEAELVWDQWFRSSSVSGGGVVQIGHDGDYHNVEPTGGYPGNPYQSLDDCLEHRTQNTGAFDGQLQFRGDDMVEKRADVSAFLGEEITVRFVFATTDSQYLVDGWYVNDVAIEVGAGPDPVTVDVPQPGDLPAAQSFEGIQTVYEEDFEEDEGGWEGTAMPTWEWGTPVSPPEVPAGSLNMWGTNLLDDTDEQVCSYVDSPPIQLPDVDAYGTAETAQLTLETFRDLAPNEDGAVVWVESEDGHWYRLEPDGGYDDRLYGIPEIACLGGPTLYSEFWTGSADAADDWQTDTFDLSEFMGEEITIRLAYASGYADDHRGVYLDEARVEVGAGVGVDAANLTDPVAVTDELCQDNLPGWDVQQTTATWCRSVPTTGPSTVDAVWATDPHGVHELGECSYLTTEPIDPDLVPGLGALTLTFEHFVQTPRYAGGIVQVSEDGGESWQTARPDDGYPYTSRDDLVNGCLGGGDKMSLYKGSTDGYEAEAFTLRGYDADTIQIRFAFAGMDIPDLGWYLRNIQLDRGVGGVPIDALTVPAEATSDVPVPAEGVQALNEVAGPTLQQTLETNASGLHEVIVTGPSHEDLPTEALDSREETMAYLDQAARPFFDDVSLAVEQFGGEVVNTWSAAPAIEIEAPVSTLVAIAGLDETRHVAQDHEGAVELVDPLPPPEDMDGISVLNSEGRQLLQAEEAWQEGYRGANVTISVIDTGVDDRHEAFKTEDGGSRLVGWNDIYDGEPEPYDDHGHGTHVAASAVGSSTYEDPNFGTFEETGVAPEADLLGVKFLSGSGAGSLSDALDALQWSYDEGANITSNSWGANCQQSTSIVSLVAQLTDLGMLSVFAAGNAGPSPGTVGGPACGEDSVTVGATDSDAEVAAFSSRGPCTDPVKEDAQERVCPDVAAKGEAVRSAVPRDGATGASPDGYRTWSGTSMATPQVAGALAIMEQMKINLTDEGWDTPAGADFDTIKDTAQRLPNFDAEPNNDYGWGIPQLMSVHTVLTSEDEAAIEDEFWLEEEQIRIGERTDFGFVVRNLGTVPATGTFEATLTLPNGTQEVLEDDEVTLSYLDSAGASRDFPVQGNTLPGEYTFAGSFTYEWEDPDTGEIVEGEIEHEDTFTVIRPYLDLELGGLAESELPGVPQNVTFAATNIGNEAASDVELRLTVPDGYEFLPTTDADLTDPNSRYSTPPPDATEEGEEDVTLLYDVGTLEIEQATAIELNLVGTLPDDYRFLAVGAFTDAQDRSFAQGNAYQQAVQGPDALLGPLP